jgi:hypothetical protein
MLLLFRWPSSPHDPLVRSLADASVSVSFANAKNAFSFLSVTPLVAKQVGGFSARYCPEHVVACECSLAWASRGKWWMLLESARSDLANGDGGGDRGQPNHAPHGVRE